MPKASARRSALRAAVGVVVSGGLLLAALPAQAAMPDPPSFPSSTIDGYASYDAQRSCDPSPKPGVAYFRHMVLAAFPGTRDGGISADCDTAGVSEHKEGRAWDWKVSWSDASDRSDAQDLIDWLMASDRFGNDAAMARRLGIMYIVWNKQIWSAYAADKGWRCYYRCAGQPATFDNDPHTTSMHISFSWDGALEETSWYDYAPTSGRPSGGPGPLRPLVRPQQVSPS